MSLLKKVKSGLSKRYQASKQERQRKQLNESALKKEVEEARWQGRRKGMLEQARKESYQRAKTKPTSHNILGTLGKIGVAAGRGLEFMNQDFGTTTPKPQVQGKKAKKKKKPKSMFEQLF
jgi:hypothetical protein